MMKTCKNRGILLIAICSLLVLVPMNVNAKTKNSVAYSVEKGVLIITGKGAIPKNISVKDKNKIKKIVVKKGITSIPIGAFSEFKNVKALSISSSVQKIGEGAFPRSKHIKKVTMPGHFKLVTEPGDDENNQLEWNCKTKIDTVIFNTSLDLKTLAYIRSNHLIVDDSDSKYTSVEGVIYSKNKKSIVRVPARRKTLTVIDGCEEFCIQSVQYATHDTDPDSYAQCHELDTIILPISVKKISYNKYYAFDSDVISLEKFIVHSDSLNDEQILMLLNGFKLKDEKAFLIQFSSISYDDGMCVYKPNSELIRYDGTEENVIIPEGVKKICDRAFAHTDIKKVIMPESVIEIGDDVFVWCLKLEEVVFPAKIDTIGESLFYCCEELRKVTLPSNLIKIPKEMFQYCSNLSNISLPSSVTTIGESAFQGTNVQVSILEQGNIHTIGADAFGSVNWEKIVIPPSIRNIDDYAFSTRTLREVYISGFTKNFSPMAFSTFRSLAPKTVLYINGDVSEWKTSIQPGGYAYAGKRLVTLYLKWAKVAGASGYQIQISSNNTFSKKKETYWQKKNKTTKKISNRQIKMKYVRIRPYKQNGKTRQYGRWATVTLPRR